MRECGSTKGLGLVMSFLYLHRLQSNADIRNRVVVGSVKSWGGTRCLSQRNGPWKVPKGIRYLLTLEEIFLVTVIGHP